MTDKMITLEELISSLPKERQIAINARAKALIETYHEIAQLHERIEQLEAENRRLRIEGELNDSAISFIRQQAAIFLKEGNLSFVDDDYFAVLQFLIKENSELKEKLKNDN